MMTPSSLFHQLHDTTEIIASFVFGADFVGFQGHFPGRPILPAICSIRAALVLLETHFDRRVKLREIQRARFSAPATFDEQLEFRRTSKGEADGERVVRVIVTRAGTTVARVRLRIELDGEQD